MNIEELKQLKESEDKVEFKEANNQYAYNRSRKSILGYTVAFANEKGGYLVLGLKDTHPHDVCGSKAYEGREGQLEQDIYRDLGIRITTEVLFDRDKRILVIKIPSRPVGKVFYFNDVPLMRVGDRLERMSDEMYLSIIQEQEPDFSAKVCVDLKIEDLDKNAIKILKEKYADKQANPSFISLPIEQVLSNLNLTISGKLTNAALILLAEKGKIREYLPQFSTIIEYRSSETKIEHDAREEFQEPLFISIDKIWNYLNQPLSNPTNHFQHGPYIIDIPRFNEKVVREAILNAIAHRSYQITSSVVIKQFPTKMTIANSGGFPLGVTLENILRISSHPRNKLLMEVLEKTGLVERSSQGIDKMFLETLSESKPLPDFSKTDDFQVELDLLGEIQDSSFAIFISEEQNKRDDQNKLGVFDLLVLDQIRQGNSSNFDVQIVNKLLEQNVIKRIGGTSSERFILADSYFTIKNSQSEVRGFRLSDLEIIAMVFEQIEKPKMGDFVTQFEGKLKRGQVKYLIEQLQDVNLLVSEGQLRGTWYFLVDEVDRTKNILDQIVQFLK